MAKLRCVTRCLWCLLEQLQLLHLHFTCLFQPVYLPSYTWVVLVAACRLSQVMLGP